MAGNNSTQPDTALVLEAMMDDLGNHRIEELARDDERAPRHGVASSVNVSGRTRPAQPRNDGPRRNGLAEMYHAAIKDGHFDDDDAAGVSGLDPLDGGNAHRLKHTIRQPLGQLRSDAQVHDGTGTSKRPKYDPRRPAYRQGKLRNRDPNAKYPPHMGGRLNTSNGLPHVSSLGGIGPEGSEIRRWDSGKLENISNKTPNRPAGRGCPISTLKNAASVQPIQTAGRGHGRGGLLPNPIGPVLNASQQPQKVGQGRGKLAHPQQSSMGGSRLVNAAVSEPQAQRLASFRQASPTDLVSEAALKVCRETSEATHSWTPPHLRLTSGVQSATSRGPNASRQASPQLRQCKNEATNLDRVRAVDKITSLDAGEIFFRDNVRVLEQHGADNKLISGRVVIYELSNAHVGVCIWELTLEDKKVTRGDIRELLEGLTYGSTAYLRRRPQGGQVRSTPLRFSGIDGADSFIHEVNFRRGQYARSLEPIYTETSVDLAPAQYAAAHGMTVEPAAVESAHTSEPKLITLCLKSPQPKRLTPHKLVPEEPKLNGLIGGGDPHNVKPQSHTPPGFLLTAHQESTPPKVVAGDNERMGSGWSDSDLMSFSPEPTDQPPRSDELAVPNDEQPVAADNWTIREAGKLTGLQPQEAVDPGERVSSFVTGDDREAEKKRMRAHAAEEATKALRDMEVTDGVPDPSPACLEVLWRMSANYAALIEKSTLLGIALDSTRPKAAFVTALLSLVEIDEFLGLSREDQKAALAHVCSNIQHGNSRIVRSRSGILALSSRGGSCPEEIKNLNALIKAGTHGKNTQTYQPSSPSDLDYITDLLKGLSINKEEL
ncbi:hypothetical protein EKO27_g373 [Xylaria grammica]|uniref:Uncharacterized protein n=1 Tax=Xylaria grammica TaxID=363999 RepID=A0A439DK26_9PEZI|nr:hypothetical protein EKO27_g373 [Xylaria grammica]